MHRSVLEYKTWSYWNEYFASTDGFQKFCVKIQIMTTLICSFKIQLECFMPGSMLNTGLSVVPKANASLIPPVFSWVYTVSEQAIKWRKIVVSASYGLNYAPPPNS